MRMFPRLKGSDGNGVIAMTKIGMLSILELYFVIIDDICAKWRKVNILGGLSDYLASGIIIIERKHYYLQRKALDYWSDYNLIQ